MKIILASQSPRRIELLKQIGLRFDAIPSNVDESKVKKASPPTYVKELARLKAEAVARQIDGGIVIGADTVVAIDRRLIGKPKDVNDAARTLRLLSGRTHEVVSGICVLDKRTNATVTAHVKTVVKFRKLDANTINWYLKSGEPFDKAGGYAIQGKGAVLIDSIRGDYSNVVGLPIAKLAELLKSIGAFP